MESAVGHVTVSAADLESVSGEANNDAKYAHKDRPIN
jgi:hypothetical protein